MAGVSEPIYESGFERDRIEAGGLPVRWWFYVFVPGAALRNPRARLGVIDHGFRFARGGRVATSGEARRCLGEAHEAARREAEYWRGQPSHALGPAGELIPLDEVLPELETSR